MFKSRRNRDAVRRFAALTLAFLMVFQYTASGLSVYSWAEDDKQLTAEEQVQETKEEAKEEVKEEAPAEEKKEEPAPQPEEKKEEPAAQPEAQPEQEPQPEQQAEEPQKEEEPKAAEEEKKEEKEEQEDEEVKYPAQSFVKSASGVTVRINAPEGALPEDSKVVLAAVKAGTVQKTIEKTTGDEVKVIKAIDITFKDKDGKEIEPKKKVAVNFEHEKFGTLTNAKVYHIEDNGQAEKLADKNVGVYNDQVSINVKDFSVYAVVDEGTNARIKVIFKNGDTEIASMYVKEADTIDGKITSQILYDPGEGEVPEGTIFKGWSTNPNYTSEDINSLLNIDDIRTRLAKGNYDWNTVIDADSTGGKIITYYAAFFKQHHVTYTAGLDEGSVVLGREQVFYTDNAEAEAPYKVNMQYTADDTHKFEGWDVHPDYIANVKDYETAEHPYKNGTNITITGDVIFVVNAPEGHWLVFDENGKGGTYNAPQFVKVNENTQEPRDAEDMERNGYTFSGWYYFPEGTDVPAPDDHGSRDLSDAQPFTFGGKLTKGMTVYAKWEPKESAHYTIIFHTQNEKDLGKYDIAGSYNGTGTVGDTIPYTFVDNGDEDYVTGDFSERDGRGRIVYGRGWYKGLSLEEKSKGQTVTITAEGDAVLHLYYKRITYNFKFYLYRERSNSTTPYSFPFNSGSGSSLDDLVTWGNNGVVAWENTHPTTSYTLEHETVGNYEYYYFVLSAYYGEDISAKWPTYDKIQGANNREPVSFVMMVGTKLKPNPTSGGSGTVKGLITVMDENILGATNDANGNYIMIRFPNSYNNWKYHIWYETIAGEDYSGKNTHTYNGITYYEETILDSRSSNTEVSSQNEPKYSGFEFLTKRGQNWNNSNFWTTTEGRTTYYHLNFVYNREQYPINYFDGVYVDGDNNKIQANDKHLLHTSDEIGYGATISDADKNYKPALPDGEKGYVFEGWYTDAGCTDPYTFTTMPVGGITVYAKWRQVQYRVFLHPEVPTSDTSLSWGSDSQAMNFRISYGGKVSVPTGEREDYDFVGWYTDAAYTHIFNPEIFILNEETVKTPYDKTTDFTDPMDKYGNGATWNSDVRDKDGNPRDRFWITEKLDLYARWRAKITDADGIRVIYDKNGGTGNPSDGNLYVDGAKATAAASIAPPAGKDQFAYWVMQTWDETVENEDGTRGAYVDTDQHIFAGQSYDVLVKNARRVPVPGEKDKYSYTVQLRAEFQEAEDHTPTHIRWFNNDGEPAIHTDNNDDYEASTLKINEAVPIQNPKPRAGYKFLGWARAEIGTNAAKVKQFYEDESNWTQNFTAKDLYLFYTEPEGEGSTGSYHIDSETGKTVTKVAADEHTPYMAMFAVWKPELKVRITGVQKTLQYNGKMQTITGFTTEYLIGDADPENPESWKAGLPAGVKVTVEEGKDTASGMVVNMNPGYPMNLIPEYFTVDPGDDYVQATTDSITIKEDGWLKIDKRPLTVKVKDQTYNYDGQPHGEDGSTDYYSGDVSEKLEVDGLVEGHRITHFILTTIVNGIPGKKTDAGVYTDALRVEEKTLSIQDFAKYYDIRYIPGTLTIKGRELKVEITGEQETKPYNGDTQSVTGFDYVVTGTDGNPVDKSVVTVTLKTEGDDTAEGKDVNEDPGYPMGLTKDSFTVTPVNGSYSIKEVIVEDGWLKITPLTVTASVKDKTTEYNGSEQYGNTEVIFTGVASGQTATIGYTPSKGTLPETYNNGEYNANSFKVVDATGADVTKNYTLGETTPGKLTITDRTEKYEITVVANSNTGNEYDGTEYKAEGFETLEFTVEGNKYTVSGLTTSDPSSINVCNLTNAISGTAVVKDAAGNDVTDQFTVGTENGNLEITARTVTVAVEDKTVEYNGSEQYGNTEYTFSNVVNGHTATITYTPSKGTLVNTYDNGAYDAESFKVVDADGEDVTSNYTLGTKTPGKLTITDRKEKYEIEVVANSNTGNIYDGTEKSATGFEMLEFEVDGNTYKVSGLSTSDPSSKNVCELPNAISGTAIVKDAKGNDVTSQFKVTTKDGKLEIKAKDVTVSVGDLTVPYNGSEQSGLTNYVFDGIVEGQTATITYSPSHGKLVDTYDNGSYADDFHVVDAAGTDVTANYNLTTKTAGKLTITDRTEKYEITVVANSSTGNKYDGTEKSATGFETLEFTINENKYTVSGLTTSDPSSKDVCELPNEISGDAIVKDAEGNDVTAQFEVGTENGTLEILPREITAKVEDKTVKYNGSEQKGNTEVSFENVAAGQTATIGYDPSYGTQVDTYDNGEFAREFQVTDADGNDVTKNYTLTDKTPGKLTIEDRTEKYEIEVVAKSSLNNIYDGTEKSAEGFETLEFTVEGNTYTVSGLSTSDPKSTDVCELDNKISGTAVVTDAQGNDVTAQFDVKKTDGKLEIKPLAVKVTVVGNHDSVDYDGEQHTVRGFEKFEADSDLYDVDSDVRFNGNALAERTDAGKTDMGLDKSNFLNTNDNFTVEFDVTDGYQEIKPIKATVTITGKTSTVPYDGTEHSVKGYDVESSTDLYTEQDFDFTGTAEAERTDAGKTDMGLKKEQFVNKNQNFSEVEFVVTDGYQEVTPIEATVTITGKTNTTTYDGDEHSVEGYEVKTSTDLYTEKDFDFTGTAEAKRKEVGKTDMGLAEDQFKNNNSNFSKVTFQVTDGYQEITPIGEVVVTITGKTNTTEYDGTEHQVSGYTVEISDPKYKESDFTFSGTAEAKRTDAGKTDMGLAEDQFTNNNTNFDKVTFRVTDGYQEITPKKVTVTIKGHTDKAEYDGKDHEVTGYDITTDDELYKTSDMTFSGEDKASGKNAGTYDMGLTKDQFANGNNNFDVTFEVTDGSLEITRKKVTVTADDKRKYVGAKDPEFTWKAEGLVEGDDESVLTVDMTRAAGEKVGTYDIIPSGDEVQGNYEVEYVNGTLTIRKIPTPGPDPDPDPTPDPRPPRPNPPRPNPNPGPNPGPGIVPFDGDDNPQNIDDGNVPLDPGDTEIDDDETPLAPLNPEQGYWALINLICTIISVIVSILVLIFYLGKSKKKGDEDNDENAEGQEGTAAAAAAASAGASGAAAEADTDEQEEAEKKRKKKGLLRILDIIPAVVAVIVFILTEDMTLPMQLVDQWTLLMLVIMLIDIILAIFTKKTTKDDDKDDDEDEDGQQPAQA